MKKYFICPDKNHCEIKDCLQTCRLGNRCSPLPFLNMAASERQWKGKPSVTQLIKGTREAFLELTQNYSVRPADYAFAILGTKGHTKLESQETHGELLTEERLEYLGITGQADLLERQDNGEFWLVDYKTSGSYKVAKALGYYQEEEAILDQEGFPLVYKTGAKAGLEKTRKVLKCDTAKSDMFDWQLQLNFYRLMYEQLSFQVDKLKIFVIVRDGSTRAAYSRGIDQNIYYIDVPVMKNSLIEDYFLVKKLTLLQHLSDNICPPTCNNLENWSGKKCQGFCKVAKFCAMQNDNPYLKTPDNENLAVMAGEKEA